MKVIVNEDGDGTRRLAVLQPTRLAFDDIGEPVAGTLEAVVGEDGLVSFYLVGYAPEDETA